MSRVSTLVVAFIVASSSALLASSLDDMTRAIEALGRYEVGFSMRYNEHPIAEIGRYRVDGDSFSIEYPDLQIFCDGELRYTVNHLTREVIVERATIEDDVQIIVNNPSKTFKALERVYRFREEASEGGGVKLLLTPKLIAKSKIESSEIELDPKTKLPISVKYLAKDEVICIEISHFESLPEPLAFSYPDDYYLIDLR
ncbi:MAG: hypothetical protein R3Y16_02310 [Rikenellaceae bacterium]